MENLVKYCDIPSFQGYRVGDDGSIWTSRRRRSWHRLRPEKEKESGYLSVRLVQNGKKIHIRVHILVLISFVGPRPDGLIACHEDDNPDNNSLKNLRWGTYKSNSQDALRNGKAPVGERNRHAKLNADQVIEIRRRLAAGEPAKLIATDFSISYWQVRSIAQGRFWKSVKVSL